GNDKLALPGEDAAALRAERHRWYAFYRATSPIMISFIDMAFHAWVQLGRHHRAEAAQRELATRRAQDEWDDGQAEEVEKWKGMLATAPADAGRGLESFAAGCRWLINRWQRLKGLLEKDGTWYGRDREEAIRL